MSSYRDCGELATGATTLGIAAAPGYPLYMSAGHVFLDAIPFGATVYRLHVLSVFCGALAVAGMWRLLSGVVPPPAALAAAGFLAVSTSIWKLSQMTEMYALNAVVFVTLLSVAGGPWSTRRRLAAGAMLAGLVLVSHQSSLFALPGLLPLVWPDIRPLLRGASAGRGRRVALLIACFAVGFGAYFYLPFRAVSGPLFNWGEPTNLARFLYMVRRENTGTFKMHQTLSQDEFTGDLVLGNLAAWGQSLLAQFGWVPLALMAVGIVAAWKQTGAARRWGLAAVIGLVMSGGVFRVAANMADTAQARALLEPSEVLAAVWAAVLVGIGTAWVLGLPRRGEPSGSPWAGLNGSLATRAGPCILAGTILITAMAHWPRVNHREHFQGGDLADNFARVLEPNGVAIVRGDIPMFLLWSVQVCEGRRRDLGIVAHNIFLWRAEQTRRRWPDLSPEIPSGSSGEPFREALVRAAATRRPTYLIGGLEPPSGMKGVQEGLAIRVDPDGRDRPATAGRPWPALAPRLVIRGGDRPGQEPEHFVREILSNYFVLERYRRLLTSKAAGSG